MRTAFLCRKMAGKYYTTRMQRSPPRVNQNISIPFINSTDLMKKSSHRIFPLTPIPIIPTIPNPGSSELKRACRIPCTPEGQQCGSPRPAASHEVPGDNPPGRNGGQHAALADVLNPRRKPGDYFLSSSSFSSSSIISSMFFLSRARSILFSSSSSMAD